MRTSLKDIAKHVGVSVSTVSYALNDGPKPVAHDLKERIKAVAAELDYRPNRVARSMKTKRSGVIGVTHPKLGSKLLFWPMIGSSVAGIADEAQDLGLDVLLYTHRQELDADDLLDTLMDGRADGMVLLAPEHCEELISLMGSRRFPMAVIAGKPTDEFPYVVINNRSGVWKGMSYLAKMGHSKIAHIAGRDEMYDGQERLTAYRDFMCEMAWPIRSGWVQGGVFNEEPAIEAATRILSLRDRPTAIFCANDRMAKGAVMAALDLGLRVPEDVSILGFDDSLEAIMSPVPLTTVRQPFYEMGRAALRAVRDMVEQRPYEKVQVFPTELIERASVTYPMEDHE